MSTRCIVEIKDSNIKELKPIVLYHHHDGYPNHEAGVGDDLLNRFLNTDTNKLNVNDINNVANALVKDTEDEYEVTVYKHVDIEYKYIIDVYTKSLVCYSVDNWGSRLKILTRYTFNELVKDYRQRHKIDLPPINTTQIKAIHAVVNELSYTDEQYRQLLDLLFHVNSCKQLDEQQASILIETLNKIKG